MSFRSVSLLLLAVACSRSPAPAQKAHPDANGGAAASPAPAKKPPRDELVKQALARVPAVRAQVAKLRELPAKDVPAEYQTQEDFQKFLEQELGVEMPPEKGTALSRSMYDLGILKEKIDLVPVLLDAFKSQAGAYYDPSTKKFFIVLVPENPTLLDVLSAHELTHAVQDQNFDLVPYLGGRGNTQGLSEDTLTARRFVMEGEATLIMMAYMTLETTKKNLLEKDKLGQLRAQIAIVARMSTDQIAQMTKSQADSFVDLGPDFKKAIDAMDKIPPYVLVPLYDAYFKGALLVLEAYAAGGWDGVKQLYTKPPTTTEQVLHPIEKLIQTRDEPVTFTIAQPRALAAWKPLHSDVLGELLWRVYFTNWGHATDADKVAAGWDGDRWATWVDGDKTFSVVATAWDSAAEATEFATAYQDTIAKRGAKAQLSQKGDRVFVAIGCDVADCKAVLQDLEKAKAK